MQNTGSHIILKPRGSLKDFLSSRNLQPVEKKEEEHLKLPVHVNPSVKDLFEAAGIPHTAVFKILANGSQETQAYNVHEGDRVDLFPFEKVNPLNLDPRGCSCRCFL